MPASNLAKRRAWVTVCVVALTVFVILGVVVGWENRIRDFDVDDRQRTFNSDRTISFEVHLVAVDPNTGTMILDWYIADDSLCQSGASDGQNLNETLCSTFVDIFFDPNLLRQDATIPGSEPQTNNLPSTPIFRYNATAFFGPDDQHSLAAFRTYIALLYFDPTGLAASLQNYPFDTYTGQIFLFAQQSATNETVGIDIHYSQGVAVCFTARASLYPSNRFSDQAFHDVLTISRGSLVKAYALIIVITIWIITLVFVASTITTAVFGYAQKVEMLVIPVPLLFPFTQLRSTMPGAPNGFGAIIDYVGLLPCLALMSICAALTACLLVFSAPEVERTTFVDKLYQIHDARKKSNSFNRTE